MTNENETVEQICENTINYKLNKYQSKMKFSGVDLHECEVELCTKILAAYKREIGEKNGERKGILKANAAFAADNTRLREELAKKDAEIARLKRENFDLNGCLLAEQELAEKRNTLIKELVDALAWCNEQAESIGKASLVGGFQMEALTMTMASMSRRCIKLVAKAREVSK